MGIPHFPMEPPHDDISMICREESQLIFQVRGDPGFYRVAQLRNCLDMALEVEMG